MVIEIFSRRGLTGDSAFLFQFGFAPPSCGTTIHAQAWVSLVENMYNKWKYIRVYPLNPLIRDDCPGGLAREQQELASWFVTDYNGNTLDMSDFFSTLSSVFARNAPSKPLIADR